jgi:hypothetical protein
MGRAMRYRWTVLWFAGVAMVLCAVAPGHHWRVDPAPVSEGIPHDVYVWQRQWRPALKGALGSHGERFRRVVVLGAEIDFPGGRMRVEEADVDFEVLRDLARPVGIALRIGPYRGTYGSADRTVDGLKHVATRLLERAKEAGVEVAELQVDFDCATSKLRGYQTWLAALRSVVPMRLTFTALPTWLNSKAFRALAHASDGYVLQVHSLENPSGIDAEMTLCDPAAARASVRRAGRVGVPFRVALPTYGYTLAFDANGKFGAIAAEGLSRARSGTRTRELRADPVAMSGLLAQWRHDRPDSMQGVIWYRLPSPDDTMNWRWDTLDSLLRGRVPRGALACTATTPRPGLWEIELLNTGDADVSLKVAVDVIWKDGMWVAADGLGRFEGRREAADQFRFLAAEEITPRVLRPGERRAVGWLRLSKTTEVEVDVSSLER